jgi:hypothetical protein
VDQQDAADNSEILDVPQLNWKNEIQMALFGGFSKTSAVSCQKPATSLLALGFRPGFRKRPVCPRVSPHCWDSLRFY